MPDIRIESGPDVISKAALVKFLEQCDESFVPPLSTRTDLQRYSAKLIRHANFVVAIQESTGKAIGVAAFYDNGEKRDSAFLSSLSVLPAHQGQGIARHLMKTMIGIVADKGFLRVLLEVDARNERAVSLYKSLGFCYQSSNPSGNVLMEIMATGPSAR